MIPTPPHFWAHVDKADTCWLWTGSTSKDGYGRFGGHATFGTTLPHRIAWQEVNGPVPDGLELDHLCETRNCVRPDHLEPVTHEENVQRALDRRTRCPNGHPVTPDNRVPHYDVDIGDRCLPCRRKANRETVRRQRGTWAIREWAWANDLACGTHGQIPFAVRRAYEQSHVERVS